MCTKYCPQEVYTKVHSHLQPLTLERVKELLKTVPKDTVLIFAGIAEPFINKDMPGILTYANEEGYRINLFTTLRGLRYNDAERLIKIPFNEVTLHLPDAWGNAHIPYSNDYLDTLYLFMTKVRNLKFMNMGYEFQSDHSEDVIRGVVKPHKPYRVTCDKLEEPAYVLLPDGNVYLCCLMRGMSGLVGSLYDHPFSELVARHSELAEEYQRDTASICHACLQSEPYWYYQSHRAIGKLVKAVRK